MGDGSDDEDPAVGPRPGGTARRNRPGGLHATGPLSAILAHPRRRHVLEILTEGPATMEELATEVAAREKQVAAADVSPQQRHTVHLGLHHVHVPKLLDEGVIAREVDSETIRPGPNADELAAALRALDGTLESLSGPVRRNVSN